MNDFRNVFLIGNVLQQKRFDWNSRKVLSSVTVQSSKCNFFSCVYVTQSVHICSFFRLPVQLLMLYVLDHIIFTEYHIMYKRFYTKMLHLSNQLDVGLETISIILASSPRNWREIISISMVVDYSVSNLLIWQL